MDRCANCDRPMRPSSLVDGVCPECRDMAASPTPDDTRRWHLGDNGDGRQWWTIVTDDGEIVAQALSREDAQAIVAAHNAGLAAAALDATRAVPADPSAASDA